MQRQKNQPRRYISASAHLSRRGEAQVVQKTRHNNEFERTEFNEETAAELSVPVQAADADRTDKLSEDAAAKTRSAARATGWTALVLAVLSWFIWPVALGGAAAVVGYVAYRQGSRGLGIWSITLGLIAAAVYLILVPLYFAVS